MKKILLTFVLIGIGSAFAESYDELYFRVVKEYGEERVQDFNNIWNYALENGAKELSWETVNELLKNGQCLVWSNK